MDVRRNTRITGLLRLAITADLVVRVKLNGTAIVTIDHSWLATAVGTVITQTTFANTPQPLTDGDVLDGTSPGSDGPKNAALAQLAHLRFRGLRQCRDKPTEYADQRLNRISLTARTGSPAFDRP